MIDLVKTEMVDKCNCLIVISLIKIVTRRTDQRLPNENNNRQHNNSDYTDSFYRF